MWEGGWVGAMLFDAGGVGERCPFASSRWLRGPASDRPRSGGRDEDRKQLSEYETNRGRAGEGEQNVSAASRAKGRIGLRTYTAASGQGMPLRRTFGHTGRPRRVCLFVCVCVCVRARQPQAGGTPAKFSVQVWAGRRVSYVVRALARSAGPICLLRPLFRGSVLELGEAEPQANRSR